jgi:hypothetical protein
VNNSASQTSAAPVSKSQLKRGWEEYRRDAEPKGLAFGKLCYDFRTAAEVVQGGTSFRATLNELGIPKSTAYFWLQRHEIFLGLRTEITIGVRPPETEDVALDTIPDIPMPDVRAMPDPNVPPVLQYAQPKTAKGQTVDIGDAPELLHMDGAIWEVTDSEVIEEDDQPERLIVVYTRRPA